MLSLKEIKLGVFMSLPSCVRRPTLLSKAVYCGGDRLRLVIEEFLLSEAKLS